MFSTNRPAAGKKHGSAIMNYRTVEQRDHRKPIDIRDFTDDKVSFNRMSSFGGVRESNKDLQYRRVHSHELSDHRSSNRSIVVQQKLNLTQDQNVNSITNIHFSTVQSSNTFNTTGV